ncbi:MAG TPA: AI-2E family transporter [Bacteroidetes bacterium]|nr:AI-2E family transporter [Bacteroidota bacterium]
MNRVVRYITIGVGVVLVALGFWYFWNIVVYVLVAGVLSLIGRPVTEFLHRLSIRGIHLPRILCALFTLVLIWIVFLSFFAVFIPLVAMQAHELSKIDVQAVSRSLGPLLEKADEWFRNMNINGTEGTSLEEYITKKLVSIFNFSLITRIFEGMVSFLGNIFLAFFSISFITLFFLRDQHLFKEMIMAMVPTRYEKEFARALSSIKKLLTRYFVGICLQVTEIIVLVTAGLSIVGIEFQKALVIGLVAGMFNVIPYLGPWIGGALGILLGIANNLNLEFYSELLPLAGYMLVVFSITQFIDNWIFYPVVFGVSVKAHPLEIFLVVLIAGSLAGIPGMILGVPIYTALRVFAKEFFSEYKLVKKITEKI